MFCELFCRLSYLHKLYFEQYGQKMWICTFCNHTIDSEYWVLYFKNGKKIVNKDGKMSYKNEFHSFWICFFLWNAECMHAHWKRARVGFIMSADYCNILSWECCWYVTFLLWCCVVGTKKFFVFALFLYKKKQQISKTMHIALPFLLAPFL